MSLVIYVLPAFEDNYLFLVRNPDKDLTAVVDPGDSAVIKTFLSQQGYGLDYIWNTHHHEDHVGGNKDLVASYGCQVWGAAHDRDRIPDLGRPVADGDVLDFGGYDVHVLQLTGHTSGHIGYYIPQEKALFCGDTLFSLGCGRLFEGTPQQMWASLLKIRQLPDDTQVFCAHEYTQANGRFAVTVETSNQELLAYQKRVDSLRKEGNPTIPCLLGLEKAINPFLRADQSSLQRDVGLEGCQAHEVFAHLRRAKDQF